MKGGFIVHRSSFRRQRQMSKLSVTIDDRTFVVELDILPGCDGTQLTAIVDDQELPISLSCLDDPEQIEWVIVEDRPHEIVIDRDLRWIRSTRGLHRLEVRDLETTVARPVSADGRVKAPIPGLITRVLVEVGDQVEPGQPILVLEAMKMENEIRAPRGGVVSRIDAGQGQGVALHQVLAEIS
jgi:acetyl/propionyl-CoA carboxylase alpha subunit